MFSVLEWPSVVRIGIATTCLDNSRHSESALIAESISAGALPDPGMSIDSLAIDVERQKLIARINYFLVTAEDFEEDNA